MRNSLFTGAIAVIKHDWQRNPQQNGAFNRTVVGLMFFFQRTMFDTGGSLLQPIHHQQRRKSGFLNHSILAVRFCGGLIESS